MLILFDVELLFLSKIGIINNVFVKIKPITYLPCDFLLRNTINFIEEKFAC